MLCDEVYAAVQAGVRKEALPHTEHIATCEACAARVDAMDFLAPAGLPQMDWDQLQTQTEAGLAAEGGLLGWLRGLSLTQQRLIVFATAGVFVEVVFFFLLRPDLAVYPTARMVLLLVGLSGTFGVGVFRLTAPLHTRLEEPLHHWIWLVLGLLWAVGLATLPQAHQAHPTANLGMDANFGWVALGCFVFGTVLALPVLAVILAVAKTTMGTPGRLFLLVSTATLFGLIGLQVHCPITHPSHLLWGHSTVTVALLLLLLVGWALTRLRRSRP